jgi:lysyl-tRNA synthetase class I
MFGITLTEETKAKMSAAKKWVKLSQETRAKLSYAASNKTEEHIAKPKAALGTAVVVSNLETNETTEYPSIREAARALKTSDVTIGKYMRNSKVFRGSYLIIISSD